MEAAEVTSEAAVTAAVAAAMTSLPPSLPPFPPSYDYDQLPSYLHPQMPTLSPLPPDYPPPPQFQPYFPAGPPCKCDVANQIRYYNYRTRRGGSEIRGRKGGYFISVLRLFVPSPHVRVLFLASLFLSGSIFPNEQIRNSTHFMSQIIVYRDRQRNASQEKEGN